MPFVSKQKGRMSHLLKIKSKVGIIHEKRKTYPAFDIEKRPRTTEDAKKADEGPSKKPEATPGGTKKITATVLEKFD